MNYLYLAIGLAVLAALAWCGPMLWAAFAMAISSRPNTKAIDEKETARKLFQVRAELESLGKAEAVDAVNAAGRELFPPRQSIEEVRIEGGPK